MDQWIAVGTLFGVLVTAAITDWKTGKIYNWLTIPAMVVGLVFWTAAGADGALSSLGQSALSLVVGFVPFALIVALGGMGGGDAKLLGAVGALCGDWRCVLATAFYGFSLAALFAVCVMVHRRLVVQTLSRLFTAVTFLYARTRPEMPTDSLRIPMGIALCIGGILAGLEHLDVLRLPWSL